MITFPQSTSSRRRFILIGSIVSVVVLVSIIIVISTVVTIKKKKSSKTVEDVLKEVPLVDGHNDFPYSLRNLINNQINNFNMDDLTNVEPWNTSASSQTDLKRLKEGGVGAQFWVSFSSCASQHKDAVQIAFEQIDVIRRIVNLNPDHLKFVDNSADLVSAHQEGKIASLIGIEGGHKIGNSLAVLRRLYEAGGRYLTLTHTCNSPWADSSPADDPDSTGVKPEHNGLSEFGKSVVREMNRLGMLIDLSHVAAQTMRDAIATSVAPVIFSHSNSRTVCNHHRNVPDDVLLLVKKNQGIVMVTFVSDYVNCTSGAEATIDDVIEHITYIRDYIGVDHIGIGGDYNGMTDPVKGLEDVSKYPVLLKELVNNHGWPLDDIKKLVGENFLRVFREVERVRDELQHGRPIEELISEADLGANTICRVGK